MKIITAVILVIFVSNVVAAQVHHVPVAAAPPNNISTKDGQYFDATVSGIRDYMEEVLRGDNKKVYRKLNRQVKSMESSKFWANTIGWGTIAAGSIIMIGGFTFLTSKETLSGIEVTKYNTGAIYGGMGLMVLGMIPMMVLKPGRKEFLKFINKHNRLNKKNKIKLQLGFAPMRDGAYAVAKVTF